VKKSFWNKLLAPAFLMFAAMASPIATAADLKPVAVVSFAGYDALIDDLNFLGKLAGAPQLAQSLEGILAVFTRAQGLAGLNKEEPIGAAVYLPEGGAPKVIAYVPVTDADKLLDVLQGLIPKVEDLGDGYSRLTLANGPPLVLKMTAKWAFLSDAKEHLDDLPKDPSSLLEELEEDYDLALQINVRNVPDMYKQLALGGLKDGFEKGMRKKADEDESAYQTRKAIGEAYLNQFTQLVEEVNHITIGFAIDSESRSAYLDAEVTVVPGGKLAKQFKAAMDDAPASKYAGFADEDAVANFHFTAPVMDDDEKTLLSGLEVARKEAAKKIDADDNLSDPKVKQTVQQWATDLFDVLEATVKGRQFNGGAVVFGDGPFDMVAGGLFVDAKKLEGVFRQAVEMFGKAKDFPEVEFDAAKHAGVTFHTLTVPIEGNGEDAKNARKVFGDELNIALGFGKSTIMIAAGPDPVETAKEVLDNSKEEDDELPPAQLQIKLGPIVKLGADSADDNKEAAQMIAKLLEDSDEDHVTVTSEYIEHGSMVRIEIEAGLLEALGKAVVAGMQPGRR